MALLLVLAGFRTSWAQGPTRTATKFYPDFSDTADALLRNAASHARDGQWAEAVEIYQRVIQQFGDKVARSARRTIRPVDPTGESILSSTSASSASAGSPHCRPRPGRSIAHGSMPRPSAGTGRGRSTATGVCSGGRRSGVLQLLGRRRARPARRPGVPGRPVRRGAGRCTASSCPTGPASRPA